MKQELKRVKIENFEELIARKFYLMGQFDFKFEGQTIDGIISMREYSKLPEAIRLKLKNGNKLNLIGKWYEPEDDDERRSFVVIKVRA